MAGFFLLPAYFLHITYCRFSFPDNLQKYKTTRRIKMEVKYLVMVTRENSNKFYRMIPHGNTWTAEYGRIGVSCTKCEYDEKDFNKKYREKINKGYVDQTELHETLVEAVKKSPEFKNIKDSEISSLVEELMAYADRHLTQQYTISSEKVTRKMIEEAQRLISNCENDTGISNFNADLLALFAALPRRMGNVNEYLASSKSDMADILQREQDLLDVMSNKVAQNTVVEETKNTSDASDKTILEVMGLDIEKCTENEIEKVTKLVSQESSGRVIKIYKVSNSKTEKRYLDYCKQHDAADSDRHLLFHGSRNENWWGILTQGLILHPNAIKSGAMFGHGLYFAPRAKKSIGYTSANGYWTHENARAGFLALYEVVYKNPMNVTDTSSEISGFTSDKIVQKGYDALYAHAGNALRNDEVIVYNEMQCTIKYIIKIS
jgi:poly [ADP-ribose] polymerase